MSALTSLAMHGVLGPLVSLNIKPAGLRVQGFAGLIYMGMFWEKLPLGILTLYI